MNIGQIEQKLGYKLSNEQKDILCHTGKPLVIVACAGSGKTTTIETKMIYDILNDKMSSNEIICITFSKAAQQDMSNKYNKLYNDITGNEPISIPKFTTFHAYFLSLLSKILRKHPKIVEIGAYQMELHKAIDYKLESGYDPAEGISDILNYRAYLMNTLQSSDGLENVKEIADYRIFNIGEYLNVISAYEALKKKRKEIDFEDMQAHLLKYLQDDPKLLEKLSNEFLNEFSKVYIDEYQDISSIQHKIIDLLLNKNYNHLCVIGDDDQSIYKFRGSSPNLILSFQNMVPGSEILHLSTNYRCHSTIVDAAKILIENNEERFEKSIQALNIGGDIEIIHDLDESSEIILNNIEKDMQDYPNDSIVILTRNNLQGAIMADKISERGLDVQFTNVSQSLQNRSEYREILDVIDMLKYNDLEAFERTGHKVLRKISRNNVKVLSEIADENGEHWTKTLIKSNIYVEANKKTILDILETSLETEDMATLYKLASHLLLPFYEELNKSIGSKKINNFNRIFSYLIYDAAVSGISYKELKAKNKQKQNQYTLNNILKKGIFISTFHSSKGLEFDRVYIVAANNGVTPGTESIDIYLQDGGVKDAFEYLEEERRLFYVACTRARVSLTLCYYGDQSIFIKELLYNGHYSVFDVASIDALDKFYIKLHLDPNLINTLTPKLKKSLIKKIEGKL